MPYDQSREHTPYGREMRTKWQTGYESLTLAQRAGYLAVIAAVALFTLFTAVVFGPAM